MVSRVTYRPFEDDDFNEIAKILQKTWYPKAMTPGYGFLQACYDLARSLSISTYSQVALIDDKPCGIVLARGSKPHRRFTAHWTMVAEDLAHQLCLSEPQAAQQFLQMNETVNQTNKRMHEQAELPPVNEITLLIVDSDAQNLGIGSLLLDAATSYLIQHDATLAYLYTDAGCNWRFYENRGFKRIDSHRTSWRDRRTMPRELYLYSASL